MGPLESAAIIDCRVILHSAGDGPTEGNSRSSYVAGLLSDARPLDTGPAPRRNTEGGIQSADKSLINRRLKRSISCSVQIPLSNNGFDLLDRSKWSLLPGRCFLPLTTDIRDYFLAQNS